MNDVHGLSASAQQAVHDANGHPLAKYHSFGMFSLRFFSVDFVLMTKLVYDTVTWRFPRASAIALFLIVSGILASQFVNFSRFVFRILWLSFASTATIEAVSKLVTGRGLVRYSPLLNKTDLNSGLKPRRYYQVNKDTMDVLFSEMANVANFLVLEFQRLLFAEKAHHTGLAFIISFLAYKLVRYIPLWGLTLMGTIMAFTIPPLYLLNQEVIDHHIHSAQSLAAEKAAYARDVAGQQVGVVSERAKFVTSEWGKKAGVELPWSPTKSPAAPPKVTTTSSTMGPSSATGVDSLHGLNVPQTTPQKRVDPAKVPLPETPAPVNAL